MDFFIVCAWYTEGKMGDSESVTQIFDVRPKESASDLDLVRLRRIRQTLSDRRVALQARYESGRIIDLREKELLTAPTAVKAVRRRKGKMRQEPMLPDRPVFVERPRPLVMEGLEISHPSREEILAILEEIEQLNSHLKQFGLREPIGPELSETAEISEEPVLAVQEMSLEEYLGLNPGSQTVESFLEERAAFPENPVIFVEDLESFLGLDKEMIVAEIATPQPLSSVKPEKKIIFFNRRLWRGTGFAAAGLSIFFGVLAMSIAGQGLLAKENILSSALEAYKAMLAAKDSAMDKDFSDAQVNFETAYQDFLQADRELNRLGGALISLLEKVPGGSIVSSGSALVQVGEDLARAGSDFAKIGEVFSFQKISEAFAPGQDSLTQKIVKAKQDIADATGAINSANRNLEKVEVSVLPANIAPAVQDLKQKLPPIAAALSELNSWSDTFLQILGHQRTKKYLLLFQNNSEARATGGFIGTYGTVELDEGQIKSLQVSNIYDLDGQFPDKIVPPVQLKGFSESWRIHDANWFADFPTSARKLALFYEKAGGSTVDGVISLTPDIIEKLLALTGPIEMPDYGTSLNAQNFRDIVQFKVEIDYDKSENRPKQILSDFAPKFLDQLWVVWPAKSQQILETFNDSLLQKDILFYFTEPMLEKKFVDQGWGGEILSTEKDYLMVVNTNVNGFKTDRMIQQRIFHEAEVQPDGSVIDTVQITRTHQGGQSQYDWYNKTNSDYMRVYVPLGSTLLSAQGFDFQNPLKPVFSEEGFKRDPDLTAQESSMRSGEENTQIFTESGKTVFGNWVFVEPGQSVTVSYQYKLPFKVNPQQFSSSYSLMAQKQPGATNTTLQSILSLPGTFSVSWKHPESLSVMGGEIMYASDLSRDRFFGIVFAGQ